jgi:citrate synthase
MQNAKITSALCTFNETTIWVRDKDLCDELIGKVGFSEFLYFLILAEWPSTAQSTILDACLVAIAEHGFSPGAVATRLTYMGAPESMQGAIAAGLLGVGDVFVGTVELVAPLLQEIVAAGDRGAETARAIVERYKSSRTPLPGFGQPHHKPDDPRPAAIFRAADRVNHAGPHIAALKLLSRTVDEIFMRHITINAPGAMAAAFLDIGIPVRIMRGFNLIARCAGLVAHIAEDQTQPAGRALWDGAAKAVGAGH